MDHDTVPRGSKSYKRSSTGKISQIDTLCPESPCKIREETIGIEGRETGIGQKSEVPIGALEGIATRTRSEKK